jgi:hypothetical protein
VSVTAYRRSIQELHHAHDGASSTTAPGHLVSLFDVLAEIAAAYDVRTAKHFPAEVCTFIEVLAPAPFIER